MNPEAALENLAPLRQPGPIDWWPPAPGWWFLAVLILAALIWIGLWAIRHRLRSRYRRRAMNALDAQTHSGHPTVDAINRLLKITALQAWPPESIAALHGEGWAGFLLRTDPKLDATALADLNNVYQTPDAPASQLLIDAARHWIRHHRRPDV